MVAANTTNITSITWSESGGTPSGIVEDLSVGDIVTLTINLVTSGSGATYTPSAGDYFTLSNGGTVYWGSGSTWTYTVGATDTYGNLGILSTPISIRNASSLNANYLVYHLSPQGGNGNGITYSPTTAYDVICFYPGTLIATPDGERAVETLNIGDLVLTTEGKTAPVRWVGRQTVSTRFANPQRVLPVRISAGALADGVPSRDLLLSPDHALLVDDVLIQARALINGLSIVAETSVPEVFTYHHIELADHALILAENTPAETFVDNVDRMGFDNWAEHEALYGHLPALAEMDQPRAKSARQVPGATRARLAARAEDLSGASREAA